MRYDRRIYLYLAKLTQKRRTMDDGYPQMILEATKRIKPHIWKTPLLHSSYLSDSVKKISVFIKLESDQLTGSFKVRGAFNKFLQLLETNPDIRKTGVYTASSGNHGLACLEAAKVLGVPLTIYCQEGVDPGKKDNLLHEGAKLVLHGNDCVEAELKSRSDAEANGTTYVSPYNDRTVVAGQGSIAVEIFEEFPEVDAVLVPVGGGGLIAGIARYIKQVKPSTKVYGCQPKNSKVMYESVKANKVIFEESYPTLSDATAGGLEESTVTFQLCRDFVDEWIMVEEEDIAKAIMFMVEKHHKIVEGAAGVSIGAYMTNMDKFSGQNVVIISCGANLSLSIMHDIVSKYKSK
ncbi:L-threonine dehydratase catabolic TdcB-like [Mytilus californianus]|uniref:L-threonine dehydratase catabolic TdcB-like n=1 Tax=Mytilus californianus TaxID=6549 RepID=UPI00224690EC|nr:L-threonine dehydratase catabolic TdcB-like [Mytilus californianus]